MEQWLYALIMGLISGTSLPLGAVLGRIYSPVRQDVVAGMMAFGAGALLFAVTVELYGESLHEVEEHKHISRTDAEIAVYLMSGACLIGAALYLWLNKLVEAYVEQYMEGAVETPSVGDAEASTARSSTAPSSSRVVKRSASTPLMLERKSSRLWRSASLRIAADHDVHDGAHVGRARSGAIVATQAVEHKDGSGMKVAFAMWLGIFIDGIPEGVLLGFLAAERQLSLVLIISLLIANFPEAFASASIMTQAGLGRWTTLGLWTAVFLITGCLCGASCFLLQLVSPDGHLTREAHWGVSTVEGLTGGAMIACVAAVMLPEAFERSDKEMIPLSSGFLCTSGFLFAVIFKVVGRIMGERAEAHHVNIMPTF